MYLMPHTVTDTGHNSSYMHIFNTYTVSRAARWNILTTMQPSVAGTQESPRHICLSWKWKVNQFQAAGHPAPGLGCFRLNWIVVFEWYSQKWACLPACSVVHVNMWHISFAGTWQGGHMDGRGLCVLWNSIYLGPRLMSWTPTRDQRHHFLAGTAPAPVGTTGTPMAPPLV